MFCDKLETMVKIKQKTKEDEILRRINRIEKKLDQILFRMKLKKELDEALKELNEGKGVGPFDSIKELRTSLEEE